VKKIAENINRIAEQEKRLTATKNLLDANKISQEQYNRELAESTKLIAGYNGELTTFKQKMEDLNSTIYAVSNALANLDYFARLGIYTTEQLLSETQNIYRQYG